MAELQVDVVSAEGRVWSGKANMVLTRTVEGEIGILPGHESVLAIQATGAVTIRTTDGATVNAAVHGGFLSVHKDNVSILAEVAELSDTVDVQRARDALARSQSDESEAGRASYMRARARLTAVGEELPSLR